MADTPKIYGQICKIIEDVGAIGKRGRNTFQKYNFRGIDDVLNELHGLLAKHKVFVCPKVLTENRQLIEREAGKAPIMSVSLQVQYTFATDDGSGIDVVTIGEAMDTSDKASNKAMSAAFKYALLQTFAIPTEDIHEKDSPTRAASARPSPPPEPAPEPGESDAPACPRCQKSMKYIPAGVSKRTGQSYEHFWGCSDRNCKGSRRANSDGTAVSEFDTARAEMFAVFGEVGITGEQPIKAEMGAILETTVTSTNDLSIDQIRAVTATLRARGQLPTDEEQAEQTEELAHAMGDDQEI